MSPCHHNLPQAQKERRPRTKLVLGAPFKNSPAVRNGLEDYLLSVATEDAGGQALDCAEQALFAEEVANQGNNLGESAGNCVNDGLDHEVILSKDESPPDDELVNTVLQYSPLTPVTATPMRRPSTLSFNGSHIRPAH